METKGMRPELLKKYCSHVERGFLAFWRGFGKGACPQRPVTEPKRSQNPKGPLLSFLHPHAYRIYDNALIKKRRQIPGTIQYTRYFDAIIQWPVENDVTADGKTSQTGRQFFALPPQMRHCSQFW